MTGLKPILNLMRLGWWEFITYGLHPLSPFTPRAVLRKNELQMALALSAGPDRAPVAQPELGTQAEAFDWMAHIVSGLLWLAVVVVFCFVLAVGVYR